MSCLKKGHFYIYPAHPKVRVSAGKDCMMFKSVGGYEDKAEWEGAQRAKDEGKKAAKDAADFMKRNGMDQKPRSEKKKSAEQTVAE